MFTEALKRFLSNESGATATEYALIAVMISVVIFAGTSATGVSIKDAYQNLFDRVSGALNGSP